jgi:Ni,Fe-hydrogenase maturation factor
MKSKPKKILIAGAGNPLRGDDGIGPYILNQVKQMDHDNRHHIIKYTDVGTDGLVLFDMMQHYTPTHTLGLGTLIHLLEQFKIETSLKIIGIEPENVALGEGLTQTIQMKLNDLLHTVAFEINQLINS